MTENNTQAAECLSHLIAELYTGIAMINLLECWNCDAKITFAERAAEDGQCPHCHAEIDLEDELIRLQDIVKTMLDNDGCDGRYDAHEFLIARDRLRELTATAKA